LKKLGAFSEYAKRSQSSTKIKFKKNPSHATVPLKKTTPLLYTSCNVHVRYPQSGPAAQNRETVTRDICRAVDTIRDIAEGGGEGGGGGGGQTLKDQGKKVCKYLIILKAVNQTIFLTMWQKDYEIQIESTF
jgi:hypothetical protein